MGSFNTLEGFWRYYVHLKRPSTLQRDVNLYIFRKGCAPMWEVSLSPCPAWGSRHRCVHLGPGA